MTFSIATVLLFVSPITLVSFKERHSHFSVHQQPPVTLFFPDWLIDWSPSYFIKKTEPNIQDLRALSPHPWTQEICNLISDLSFMTCELGVDPMLFSHLPHHKLRSTIMFLFLLWMSALAVRFLKTQQMILYLEKEIEMLSLAASPREMEKSWKSHKRK